MNRLILILFIMLLLPTRSAAHEITFEQAKDHLNAFESKIKIPSGYYFRSVKKVQADHISAYLFRYEKTINTGYNKEHFSFLVSEDNKQILGFTNMDKKYSHSKMVSKSEAEKIAKSFLLGLDESLANDLDNLWIEKHDEEIFLKTDQATVISGMKYKCYRPSSNDYTWVIIGFDGTVITFERNIKWNTEEHRRVTQKWLHDQWLIANMENFETSDEEQIKKLLRKSFLNGILNELNTEDIDSGFHHDFAILIPDGNKLNRLELPAWKKVVEAYKNSPEKIKSGDRNVEYKFDLTDVTGNAAIVKIQLMRKGQLITTDYISLLKFGNEWKAVAKVSNEHIANPFHL